MEYPLKGFLLFFLCVIFSACHQTGKFSYLATDIGSYHNKKVSLVTTKNGEIFTFDKEGGRYYEEKKDSGLVREIVGMNPDSAQVTIPLNRLLEVQCESEVSDGAATILLVLSIATTLVLFIFHSFSTE